MIYYTTGKGNFKRGEIGLLVETDEKTAKILIERGYLMEEKTKNKIVNEIPRIEIEEIPVVNKIDIQVIEKPKGRPKGTTKQKIKR